MYHLKTAYVRSYNKKEGIRELDVSNLPIRDVISKNAQVYLILTNDYLPGEHVLELDAVYELIYSKPYTLTVVQWLSTIGNTTLPTKSGKVSIQESIVQAMDAYAAGYTITTSTGGTLADTDDTLDIDRPHLALTEQYRDFTDSHRNLLASVNGLLHFTDSDKNALYIKDGAISARMSGSNRAMLYNFGSLGDMRCYPFELCEITPKVGNDLFNGVTVTTPFSLRDKTIVLSIMGHMYYSGSNFKVLGDNSVLIEWKEINPYRNYFRNKDRIDLSLIDAVMSIMGGTNILNKEVFKSNAVINAILNLSQSFIIVIDNPSITFELERVEETGLPGKWLSYGNPNVPYLSSSGHLVSVSTIKESRCHVISTSLDDNYTQTFYEDTQNPDDSTLHTDAKLPYRKVSKVSLYKMHIRSSYLIAELI